MAMTNRFGEDIERIIACTSEVRDAQKIAYVLLDALVSIEDMTRNRKRVNMPDGMSLNTFVRCVISKAENI